MSGNASKVKGKRGENELANLLSRMLGVKVSRNLQQSSNGGYDLQGIDGWGVEVKRQESLGITEAWRQAVKQAECAGVKPALAYRRNRQSWRVIVALDDIGIPSPRTMDFTAELGIIAFAFIVQKGESA